MLPVNVQFFFFFNLFYSKHSHFCICCIFSISGRSKHCLVDCEVHLLRSVSLCQPISGKDYPKLLYKFPLQVVNSCEFESIKV